jgi:hypothetical protein
MIYASWCCLDHEGIYAGEVRLETFLSNCDEQELVTALDVIIEEVPADLPCLRERLLGLVVAAHDKVRLVPVPS